jgi:EAL domain-containing protein (putative c-di-GMP-specific phosphodiesterase class I)
MAMVAAKRRRDGPQVYDPAIDVTSAQTLTLLTELRHALERGEMRLYLQPRLALEDSRIVGAEALVRWQHPGRGLVPPMQFVPFAEQTGFIRVLTMWVFEEAARHWKALVEEGHDLALSVNLSTRDLMDPELPRKFQALLGKHLVPASAFCLEITESAIMDDPQHALVDARRAERDGLQAVDRRLRTGYSSLAYLKRLPVDELKIDQSFVVGMPADVDDETIVRSTIALAHNLGIVVVAEGVEKPAGVGPAARDALRPGPGLPLGQPMPAAEFPTWSRGWYAALPFADPDGVASSTNGGSPGGQAAARPARVKGRRRTRWPFSLATALATAGPRGGTPGSPTPVGAAVLGTMKTSTFGISLMRSGR